MGADYRISSCPDGLFADRRRRVKVLDCTIRDGGLCNHWHFDHALVGRCFEALVQAGVDYMEVGYRSAPGSFDAAQVGPWRFCREDELERVVAPGRIKLTTMVDIGRIRPRDIPPKADSVIDGVRVATYVPQLDEALPLVAHCLESGYETFLQIMAVSEVDIPDLDHALERTARSGVHAVALVDSYGALYPYHVRYLLRKYQKILGERGIRVGAHFHNNQQQAFANTITAIDEGVDWVDATIHGIGRGAGNCPLELLLFYLDNPRYDPKPILDLVDEFATLRDDLRWGYHLPYAITGYYNVHPREGIRLMATPDRYRCRTFYESLQGRFQDRGGPRSAPGKHDAS
ncbi:MAG: aldolase catalytic domain-containing protein [Deltaproteobacteria bacterium]|nr:aldolase catalytic domain-containing protein [Deltaproteobacteria bacterium]